jgi:hypothetical protein
LYEGGIRVLQQNYRVLIDNCEETFYLIPHYHYISTHLHHLNRKFDAKNPDREPIKKDKDNTGSTKKMDGI